MSDSGNFPALCEDQVFIWLKILEALVPVCHKLKLAMLLDNLYGFESCGRTFRTHVLANWDPDDCTCNTCLDRYLRRSAADLYEQLK